eukprot:GILJ01005523.1.p1 GENE.GILJ01005523.1~~GILJ01005523.1.p1  ORF type:complete len:775 (-),score=172.84 GILJ01005523.1:226-2436(-)
MLATSKKRLKMQRAMKGEDEARPSSHDSDMRGPAVQWKKKAEELSNAPVLSPTRMELNRLRDRMSRWTGHDQNSSDENDGDFSSAPQPRMHHSASLPHLPHAQAKRRSSHASSVSVLPVQRKDSTDRLIVDDMDMPKKSLSSSKSSPSVSFVSKTFQEERDALKEKLTVLRKQLNHLQFEVKTAKEEVDKLTTVERDVIPFAGLSTTESLLRDREMSTLHDQHLKIKSLSESIHRLTSDYDFLKKQKPVVQHMIRRLNQSIVSTEHSNLRLQKESVAFDVLLEKLKLQATEATNQFKIQVENLQKEERKGAEIAQGHQKSLAQLETIDNQTAYLSAKAMQRKKEKEAKLRLIQDKRDRTKRQAVLVESIKDVANRKKLSKYTDKLQIIEEQWMQLTTVAGTDDADAILELISNQQSNEQTLVQQQHEATQKLSQVVERERQLRNELDQLRIQGEDEHDSSLPEGITRPLRDHTMFEQIEQSRTRIQQLRKSYREKERFMEHIKLGVQHLHTMLNYAGSVAARNPVKKQSNDLDELLLELEERATRFTNHVNKLVNTSSKSLEQVVQASSGLGHVESHLIYPLLTHGPLGMHEHHKVGKIGKPETPTGTEDMFDDELEDDRIEEQRNALKRKALEVAKKNRAANRRFSITKRQAPGQLSVSSVTSPQPSGVLSPSNRSPTKQLSMATEAAPSPSRTLLFSNSKPVFSFDSVVPDSPEATKADDDTDPVGSFFITSGV